jgi:hypothetical protein
MMEAQTSLALVTVEIARQAINIGYINVFNLFLWTSLLPYPLIVLVAWPPKKQGLKL